ncbi:MAG: hypothetical protein ACK56F_11640, partial [bacterium]
MRSSVMASSVKDRLAGLRLSPMNAPAATPMPTTSDARMPPATAGSDTSNAASVGTSSPRTARPRRA